MQRNVPHPDHQPLPPPPPPTPAPIAGGGAGQGGHQACASCKHQRKKCSENCELAPYFPADKTDEFGLVQKIYGVSNIVKMVRANESDAERWRCVQTLVWEATWRNKDFADGCYNEVMRLKNEIAILRAIIANCGDCSSQPLPEPYCSPVPQPVPYRAHGNNNHDDDDDDDNNGTEGNLIREGIDDRNGNLIHGYHDPHEMSISLGDESGGIDMSISLGDESGGIAQSIPP